MLLAALLVALHADAGWFADAFALDGAGGRLAAVRVAADGAVVLEVRDVGLGAVLWRARLDAAPTELAFTPGGLLVVWGRRSAPPPAVTSPVAPPGAGTAVLYDDAGAARARYGPAIDVAASGDRIGVVTATEVTLYDVDRPERPLVHRALGKRADFEPRWWRAGYTQLVGRRPGRYDRALDRRLPDTEASYDVEKGTFSERPIADPIVWERIARERAARPNQDSFALADGAIVTAGDRIVPIALGPIEAAEPHADGQLVISVAAGAGLDLYRLEPGATGPEKLGRLPGAPRWHVAGGRVAVLERGVDLRVLEL
jgi:hypothetical protein